MRRRASPSASSRTSRPRAERMWENPVGSSPSPPGTGAWGRYPKEPRRRTLPWWRSWGEVSPTSTEMKDDLPVPLRPTRPTFSPAPTTKEASERRVRSPISMVSPDPTITHTLYGREALVYTPQMPALDRKWWTLIAVCTATFMLLLDITVVNVALPDIQRSLNASFSDLQWVVDAYSLTLAAFLLTAGVAGDIYGRRKIFAIGLVVFSAASLVCGLSTTPLMLNLARAVQGVGGAIMFATSLALIAAAFTGQGPRHGLRHLRRGDRWRRRHRAAHRGRHHERHRLALDLLRERAHRRRSPSSSRSRRSPSRRTCAQRKIDWVGFLTFSLSLFAARLRARARATTSVGAAPTTIGLLAGAAVLMVAFFVNEHYAADPMLDLGLFKIPAFVGPLDRGLLPGRVDLRHVLVPDPLHPGRPGLRTAGRRRPLPPDDAAHLLRRPSSPGA